MSVNKVILLGNVGKDPEVRYVDNNVAVANFTLATTERGYTTRDGKTIPDRTEWHNIVVWRGLAETAEKYVKKGMQLYIEGKIQTRSWTDKDGNKRYTVDILGDVMQMLGRKNDSNSIEVNDSNPAEASTTEKKVVSSKKAEEEPFSNVPQQDGDDLPF
ncbi:MAG: single-stranded DNA-binding protein [Paludibacteraceae bacterium]|jgi:single-strand DNA-binding protein|nr:single-stranded DNA-binding protein [Paludibacteraceae bacterium]OQA49771.1 MAG: Single-stranded DNA-binding protein [Bacteroidetes bacterium ADurb.Bin302]HPG54838.1 single-stranded DNA-binding protein [Candidatus Enterocola sp.]